MITVKPGKNEIIKNPNADPDERRKLVDECVRIINASEPFLQAIHIHNQTKYCTVQATMSNGTLHVTVTNPADAEFTLEEPALTKNGDLEKK